MKYTQNNVNLHTHSFYCGHGTGEINDYVKAAEKDGRLKVLGFSEHCPVPDDDIPSRMKFCMMESYLNDVDSSASQSRIKILKGFECDWRDDLKDFYRSLESKTDYLIGAVHHLFDRNKQELEYVGRIRNFDSYIDEYVDAYTAMLKSGLFLFGCHPDLFLYNLEWNGKTESAAEKIISTARQYDVPLEVNGQGLRKRKTDENGNVKIPYPVPQFWHMAKKYGIKICCSSDAHAPENVYEDRCFGFAEECGLEYMSWDI